MSGTSYEYTDDGGTVKAISYAQTFIDTAVYSNVNPYPSGFKS